MRARLHRLLVAWLRTRQRITDYRITRADSLIFSWGAASWLVIVIAVGALAGFWWGVLALGVASGLMQFSVERQRGGSDE